MKETYGGRFNGAGIGVSNLHAAMFTKKEQYAYSRQHRIHAGGVMSTTKTQSLLAGIRPYTRIKIKKSHGSRLLPRLFSYETKK